jgi:hypothetical protein
MVIDAASQNAQCCTGTFRGCLPEPTFGTVDRSFLCPSLVQVESALDLRGSSPVLLGARLPGVGDVTSLDRVEKRLLD